LNTDGDVEVNGRVVHPGERVITSNVRRIELRARQASELFLLDVPA
jgi:hypothetical protein